MVFLDLRPDLSLSALTDRLGGPRRSQSLSNTLRKQAGLSPEAIGLVQEALHSGADSSDLPGLIKELPVRLVGTAPIARAISSAGGVRLDALDGGLMATVLPLLILTEPTTSCALYVPLPSCAKFHLA